MKNKTCPECGATVDSEINICPECGFNFSNEKNSENKTSNTEMEKADNLLLYVPYRFDFDRGWKKVLDLFLSFSWLIGAALVIAGIIVYCVAGAKSADDPLEILVRAVKIKEAHDTVNILVMVGLIIVLVHMLGEAMKDAYLKICYGKWISNRKEQAVETILKYDVATASAKENDFIETFANATYHAHNPDETRFTAVTLFVYVIVCLFAMISSILLAKECVDLISVKMIKGLIGEKFNIIKNLPLKPTIICGLAWVAYTLINKLCAKSYEGRYNKWAKQMGILSN